MRMHAKRDQRLAPQLNALENVSRENCVTPACNNSWLPHVRALAQEYANAESAAGNFHQLHGVFRLVTGNDDRLSASAPAERKRSTCVASP